MAALNEHEIERIMVSLEADYTSAIPVTHRIQYTRGDFAEPLPTAKLRREREVILHPTPKLSGNLRNAPCPCGCGRKRKRCEGGVK